MIKVEIAGTLFYCETAREAADLATLMKSKRQETSQNPVESDEEITSFIKLIKGLPNTSVSSSTLADGLDVAVQGLGPKLRGISRRFEDTYHQRLDTVLIREGRAGQPTVWKVNRSVLEKMDIFS